MSFRLCAKCDWVINNRTQSEWPCPVCQSEEMVDPIQDLRDWQEMYDKQWEKLREKAETVQKTENGG